MAKAGFRFAVTKPRPDFTAGSALIQILGVLAKRGMAVEEWFRDESRRQFLRTVIDSAFSGVGMGAFPDASAVTPITEHVPNWGAVMQPGVAIGFSEWPAMKCVDLVIQPTEGSSWKVTVRVTVIDQGSFNFLLDVNVIDLETCIQHGSPTMQAAFEKLGDAASLALVKDMAEALKSKVGETFTNVYAALTMALNVKIASLTNPGNVNDEASFSLTC